MPKITSNSRAFTVSKPKQAKVVVEQAPAANQSPQTKHLFIRVNAFNAEGREVGTRIVDLYHFGTRAWLQKHTWWAMHHGHVIEQQPATEDEIAAYIQAQRDALAAKYNPQAEAA